MVHKNDLISGAHSDGSKTVSAKTRTETKTVRLKPKTVNPTTKTVRLAQTCTNK